MAEPQALTQTQAGHKINLFVEEIYFEVRNETYLTGATHKAVDGNAYQAAANMQASDDEQHSYKILRSINNAINKIKSELSEYLVDTKSLTNNLIKQAVQSKGKIVLTFDMPSNYNQAAFDSLGSACHDFIVKTSVFDFFTITNPQSAATYKALADDSLETAKRALYNRARPHHNSDYFDATEDGNCDPTANPAVGTPSAVQGSGE